MCRSFSKLGSLVLAFVLVAALHASAQDSPKIESVISELDQPFLFSYSSWQDKAVVRDGIAIVRGVNNQGGAGINRAFDLNAFKDSSPALLIKTGSGNKMKTIQLLMLTESEQKPTWLFELPPADGKFHWVTPVGGASLAKPNRVESERNEPFKLDKFKQWQFVGDWAGGVAADFEVDKIAVVAPSSDVVAARQAEAKKMEAEQLAKQREQESLKAKYADRNELSPTVLRTSLVAPDMIAIEIQAGEMSTCEYSKYKPEPNDVREEKKETNGDLTEVQLKRGGKVIGSLIGEKRDYLVTYEYVTGNPLLDFAADDSASYRVRVGTNEPIAPIKVARKTRVIGWAHGSGEMALHHTLYLQMDNAIPNGSKVEIDLSGLNTRQSKTQLDFDITKTRSEAVHVNQIGYRPDDPIKRAFVSCWLGSGGSMVQPDKIPFMIIDDASGKVVHRGEGGRHFPADKIENMGRQANFNGTDVAKLEFTEFQTPGRYRIVVQGVGCSYPFDINDDVWTSAWRTQMHGLYNNRSGVEIGPPYSDFRKPRDMHPADGYRVTRSKYRAVEAGNEAYALLAAGDTGEPADGWGGYHDAGDWNPRRVTHMRVTMAMLELFDQFQDRLQSFDLNIPETKGMPDMLTEAVFEFSCFRRLQLADGGVGMGLESKGDPLQSEVSWRNSFPSYAYAPDYNASWCYAAVGARLSRLLEPYDASLATDYLDSAKRAFEFAEQDFAKDKAAGLIAARNNTWEATDQRNFAAIELYRTTSEDRYHDLFLEDSSLTEDEPDLFQYGKAVQRDQAFAYARLPKGMGDENLKQKAVAAIERVADRGIAYAEQNAFNLTSIDQGKPQFIGFYSTPDSFDMTRAHALTGKQKYLVAAVQSTQFQSGCNPNNVVYTTGIGANPLTNVFKLDARFTGQAVPPGLTPYGNIDFGKWNNQGVTWPITWFLGRVSTPNPYAWPTHEAYWDLGRWPMLEEFTVDAWTPNVLVWGYLAMRDELK